MSTDIAQPSAALHSSASRASVALALAILALPGVTIAWALPLGGLWIGVPLSLTALAIGRGELPRGRAKAAMAIATIALVWVPICAAFVK